MTFREILAGVKGSRVLIGTLRSTLDAFCPGQLDKTVTAKIVRGTADVVLVVDGKAVGTVTCEVIERAEDAGLGNPVEAGFGTPVDPVDVGGQPAGHPA